MVTRWLRDDSAQSLLEYAVLVALLTVLAVTLGYLIGDAVQQLLGGTQGGGGTPTPEPPAPRPTAHP